MRRRTLTALLIALTAAPGGAWACSVGRIPSADELVRTADLIIRARPTAYAMDPGPPNPRGQRDIAFDVLEVVYGTNAPSTVSISGQLVATDDFNDKAVPYAFVRPEGRHGDCFATVYRTNADYLLFLRQAGDRFTPYWAALAPVNEQLRSAQDPWIIWVRQAVAPRARTGAKD